MTCRHGPPAGIGSVAESQVNQMDGLRRQRGNGIAEE